MYTDNSTILAKVISMATLILAETTEIVKPTNRSCIMEITAYHSEVNNENTTKKGEL